MREHGRVNLILGEIALQEGDREQARLRFRAALRWDPRLPIRRTLERLENPTPLSFTSRRAA
jgi:predicted negative regulator of RcsB-dependent stress response